MNNATLSPGPNNVTINLATVDVKTKKIRFVDTGENKDIYIPRVKWMPDAIQLTYQWQSRDQKTLKINKLQYQNTAPKNLTHRNIQSLDKSTQRFTLSIRWHLYLGV